MLPTAQDAKKMPPLVQPRAEKRKLIEEELNCSLKVFVNLFVKEAIMILLFIFSVATEAQGQTWFWSPFSCWATP